MAALEERDGVRLDALARMRTRCLDEIKDAEIGDGTLTGPRGFLLLILLKALSALDSIRILLEHAYAEEAFGLTRTLYDLEVDSLLLKSGDTERLSLYSEFERFELARFGGMGVAAGLLPETDEREQAIATRIEDLATALVGAGREPPDNFNELSLFDAAAEFARLRFGQKHPTSWRPSRKWDDILDEIAPALIRLLEPELETSDPDRFAALVQARKTEHWFTWPLSSAVLHGSPRSVAVRYPDFRVAGVPGEVARTAAVAAAHFARIHHIAFVVLDVGFDAETWNKDLRATRP